MAGRTEITVQVKNLEAIKEQLRKLPYEISQKVLEKSVRAQVVTWQKRARSLAPAYDRVHVIGRKPRQLVVAPGNLRKSITVKKLKVESLTQEARYGIQISERAFYWRWIEFGSSKHQRIGFLRNTFDQLVNLSINSIAGDCQKFIERYFKRGKV